MSKVPICNRQNFIDILSRIHTIKHQLRYCYEGILQVALRHLSAGCKIKRSPWLRRWAQWNHYAFTNRRGRLERKWGRGQGDVAEEEGVTLLSLALKMEEKMTSQEGQSTLRCRVTPLGLKDTGTLVLRATELWWPHWVWMWFHLWSIWKRALHFRPVKLSRDPCDFWKLGSNPFVLLKLLC